MGFGGVFWRAGEGGGWGAGLGCGWLVRQRECVAGWRGLDFSGLLDCWSSCTIFSTIARRGDWLLELQYKPGDGKASTVDSTAPLVTGDARRFFCTAW
jgi:hypothetical protein